MQPPIKPSQWINIAWLGLSIFLFIFAYHIKLWNISCAWFGLGAYIFKCIETYYWVYEFDYEQMCERKGVFNVTREYINYYRVKSIKVEEPFIMRLLGLSIIHIITSEQYKPYVKLYAIKDGSTIKDFLDNIVLKNKVNHDVHEVDMFNTNK